MTRRLLLGLLAFASIVLALLVIPLGISGQRNERAQLVGQLERDAMAAASIAVDLLAIDAQPDRVHEESLRRQLDEYATRSLGRVVVVDRSGKSVVDTGEPGRTIILGRDFSTRPEVASALKGRVESGERGSDTLKHPLLFVAAPVASSGTLLGAVRISHPADALDGRIARQWTALAATSLAVLGVATIAALLVAAWISRPLQRIASVADQVGDGNLSARADVQSGPPEIRAVAARLDASVAALDRMFQDQRDFTADASHQLRTPLHALTLRLDNAAHELAAGDADTAAADVERASLDVARLAALVESLLVLERADRNVAGDIEPIDLAVVIAARVDVWIEQCERGGITLIVDVASHLTALARELHVEQVLDNYVDNAITATPAGGTIRITGYRRSNRVELHVIDDGPGMPTEDLELVFRRFHSGADRPRGATAGGFGLGLAIVRRLAQLDGGSVELQPGPTGGIDAVVRYPVAPDARIG